MLAGGTGGANGGSLSLAGRADGATSAGGTAGLGTAGRPGTAGSGGSSAQPGCATDEVSCKGACLKQPGDQTDGCRLIFNAHLTYYSRIRGMQLVGDTLYITQQSMTSFDAPTLAGVSKLPLSTLAPETITTVGKGTPTALAVDGDTIYFSNRGEDGSSDTLRSVPLSGGDSTLLASGIDWLDGVSILRTNADSLFFSNGSINGKLGSLPKAGGTVTDAAFGSVSGFEIGSGRIAIVGSKSAFDTGLYQTSLPFPLDRAGAQKLSSYTLGWLASDATYLYYLDLDDQNTLRYFRVPWSGASPAEALPVVFPFKGSLVQGYGLGDDVFISAWQQKQLYVMPKTGGTVTLIADGMSVDGATLVAASPTHVYLSGGSDIIELTR